MSEGKRAGLFSRLYNGETDFDFIGRTRLWFAISGIFILVGLASLGLNGLNLGIDFEGGTVWEVPSGGASVADATDAVGEVGLDDPSVQTLSSPEGTRLRVQAEPSDDVDQDDVVTALAELASVDADEVSVNEVGPSWGQEITDKAVRALAVFLVAITLYITFRFELKMAIATVAAMVHDILITVGVYSLLGLEVTPATVIAILTILGFSIYDGIVVFDKVDENARTLTASGRTTYSTMVNDSLNQVLMRTLNTSITALLPILSLLVIGSFVLGATTLEEFALALLIGLGSGAYSSIYIASPLLAILKEREPRYRAIRRRQEAGRAPLAPSGGRPAPASDDETGDDGSDERPLVAQRSRPTTSGGAPVAPRPRKKGRKR